MNPNTPASGRVPPALPPRPTHSLGQLHQSNQPASPPPPPPPPISSPQPRASGNHSQFFSDNANESDEPDYDTFKRSRVSVAATAQKFSQPNQPATPILPRKPTLASSSQSNLYRPSVVGNPPPASPNLSTSSTPAFLSSYQQSQAEPASIGSSTSSSVQQPQLQSQSRESVALSSSASLSLRDMSSPSLSNTGNLADASATTNFRPYGTTGVAMPYLPDSPEHHRIFALIKTRSMTLYNALYKINRSLTVFPSPSYQLYSRSVQNHASLLEKQQKKGDDKKQSSLIDPLNQQPPQPQSISQGFRNYHEILGSSLHSAEDSEAVMCIFNSIFDLQKSLSTAFDTATGIETQFAYLHQSLEKLNQDEDECRRKLVTATKEYLSLKQDSKKADKITNQYYQAVRNYEDFRIDSCYQVAITDLVTTSTIIKPLSLRLQAYYDFFKKGYELLEPMKAVLDNIQNQCNEEDRFVTEQKLRRAEEMDENKLRKEKLLLQLGCESSSISSALSPLPQDKQASTTSSQGKTGIRDLDNREVDKNLGNTKQGYLFTPPPNAMRVWVELKDKVLKVYEEVSNTTRGGPGGIAAGALNLFGIDGSSSSTSSSQVQFKVMFETPTMLLTAKPLRESKYRFVFQLICPSGNYTLQAESESIMNEWLDCIQNAVGDDLQLEKDDPSDVVSGGSSLTSPEYNASNPFATGDLGTSGAASGAAGNATSANAGDYDYREMTRKLYAIPGNTLCADCRSPNPDWISINLGILICLGCSGGHRQLGVSISKIRSIKMDKLDQHIINYASIIGNELANSVLLEQFIPSPDNPWPLQTNASGQERLDHIRAKYLEKRWVIPDVLLTTTTRRTLSAQSLLEVNLRLTTLLYNAIRQNDPLTLYRAVVCGADPSLQMENESAAPIFEVILYNLPNYLTCLLQFLPNVNVKEDRGWNCLHYAAFANSLEMVEICLSFGGSELAMECDIEGKTASDVAIQFNGDDESMKDTLPLILSTLQAAQTRYQKRMAKKH